MCLSVSMRWTATRRWFIVHLLCCTRWATACTPQCKRRSACTCGDKCYLRHCSPTSTAHAIRHPLGEPAQKRRRRSAAPHTQHGARRFARHAAARRPGDPVLFLQPATAAAEPPACRLAKADLGPTRCRQLRDGTSLRPPRGIPRKG